MSHQGPTSTVPRPPRHFLLGNAPDVGKTSPVQSLMRMARQYGPIYQLALPGRTPYVVSGFPLVDEICSDKSHREASPSVPPYLQHHGRRPRRAGPLGQGQVSRCVLELSRLQAEGCVGVRIRS